MIKIRRYPDWYFITMVAVIIAMVYNLCPIVSVCFPRYINYGLMLLMCGLTLLGMLLKDLNSKTNTFLSIIPVFVFVHILYFGKWKLADQGAETDYVSRIYDLFSFWLFFLLAKNVRDFPAEAKNKVWNFYFVLITITSITTIRGLAYYPLATRLLGGLATKEQRLLFCGMNIGSYDYIYGIAFLMPFLFYVFQKSRCRRKKILIIGLICLNEYLIVKSQLATALIVSLVAIVLSICFYSTKIAVLCAVGSLLCPVIYLSGIVIRILQWFRNIVLQAGWMTLSERINQLISLFNGTHLYGTSQDRLGLYRISFNVFKETPIYGCLVNPQELGQHSDFFDLLAAGGILAFLLFLSLMYNHERMIAKKSSRYLRIANYISLFCFGIVGTLNTVFIFPVMAIPVFLVPVLFLD